MDIEVLKKLFNYAAHLQHIYSTCVAALVQECAVAEYVLVYGEMEENISFLDMR